MTRKLNLTKKHSGMRPSGRSRRGSITLVAALGMIVILGAGALAVDYSILLADRNRLQRACDAAALAGASQLKITGNDITDTANARALAVTVAGQNNVVIQAGDITFLNDNRQIRVSATVIRNMLFGRALGIMSKPVAASATAGVSAGGDSTTEFVVPIGITWETYNAYKNDKEPHELSLVRQNKSVFQQDDFVLFDLRSSNGKSPAHMERQLTHDEIVPVTIGSFQTTLNAADNAQRSKLQGGFDTLVDRAADSPWNDPGSEGYKKDEVTAYEQIYNGTLDRSNPRVVYIIITPSTTSPKNGTFNTEVQALAPVYLESLGLGAKHSEDSATLTVRFLPPTSASDGGFKPNPGAAIGGVRVVSLIG